MIRTRSERKLSDGSRSQQRRKASVVGPTKTADIIAKMTEEAGKAPEDTAKCLETVSRSLIHSGFDNRLSGKLMPGYTELSMAIDVGRRSLVLNCCESACVRELVINDKYEQINPFLCTYLILNSLCVNVFFQSNQCYFYKT